MNPARVSDRRRLMPSVWHHDWYVLSQLTSAIRATLGKQVALMPGHRVVDLGCGCAPYRALFDSVGCTYLRCDLEGEVDIRVEEGQPIGVPTEYADGVVSTQVLEHVWNIEWYLGECRRILKPGGWLLLSTHGTWLYHPLPGDYRRWTREGLIREIEASGFSVESIEAVAGPLAWTTLFRLFGMRAALADVPVVGSILVPILCCIMNLRMLAEDRVTPVAIREANASVYVTLSRRCDV